MTGPQLVEAAPDPRRVLGICTGCGEPTQGGYCQGCAEREATTTAPCGGTCRALEAERTENAALRTRLRALGDLT